MLATPVAQVLVAVIVAVPFAIAVTRPSSDTVATSLSDVAHVTVAPLIGVPFWPLTRADSWDVAPSEAKLTLVAERVIDVATGVGVGVGVGAVGVSSPPQLHNNSENNTAPNATVFFMPDSAPPHSGPQLRTSKTVLDSWVWLDATEGLGSLEEIP